MQLMAISTCSSVRPDAIKAVVNVALVWYMFSIFICVLRQLFAVKVVGTACVKLTQNITGFARPVRATVPFESVGSVRKVVEK